MHAIVNGRIVLSDKILDGCALLFDKNIIGIVSRETLDAAWADGQSWKGKPLDITDAGGNYVALIESLEGIWRQKDTDA